MCGTKTIFSEVLDETADSIEALPDSNVFVCATYQLVKDEMCDDSSSNTRVGSLRLYEVEKQDDHFSVSNLQTISLNAILDMKWKSGTEPVLTISESTGCAKYYRFQDRLLSWEACLEIDTNSLCLSADWCKSAVSTKVAYSMSSGELVTVDYSSTSPTIVDKWKGHSLEAWIIAADRDDDNLFYSGADDCLMKMWDTRMGFTKPCALSKHHTMGVCSIQSYKHAPNIFCSGSYDETIAVWDNRSLKSPLNEVSVGGGVWRLKWHPWYPDYLLAACMHDGFKIVKYENGLSVGKVVSCYDAHKSLAYGTDWLILAQPETDSISWDSLKNSSVVPCCSFYDKLLTIWALS